MKYSFLLIILFLFNSCKSELTLKGKWISETDYGPIVIDFISDNKCIITHKAIANPDVFYKNTEMYYKIDINDDHSLLYIYKNWTINTSDLSENEDAIMFRFDKILDDCFVLHGSMIDSVLDIKINVSDEIMSFVPLENKIPKELCLSEMLFGKKINLKLVDSISEYIFSCYKYEIEEKGLKEFLSDKDLLNKFPLKHWSESSSNLDRWNTNYSTVIYLMKYQSYGTNSPNFFPELRNAAQAEGNYNACITSPGHYKVFVIDKKERILYTIKYDCLPTEIDLDFIINEMNIR
jgi:hypothetical protein